MKISTFLIVVLLGVIFFSLAGDRLHWKMPAPIAAVGNAFNSFLSMAGSPSHGKQLKVPSDEPRPSVHFRKLAKVKGKVLHLVEGAAVVDCSYQAPIPGRVAAKYQQMIRENEGGGRADFSALAQAEADQLAFGNLMMLDENNTPRVSEHSPPIGPEGKILLRGMPLAAGDPVHLVAAPVGKSPEGAPIYTARFVLQGGAWMWQQNPGTLLDKPAKFIPPKPVDSR